MKNESTLRMPAEWEKHQATWIAWPHESEDWPDKIATVSWVYAEIVRTLTLSERVEILCHNQEIKDLATFCLDKTRVDSSKYRLHLIPNDRSWLRDSLPTAVKNHEGKTLWISWLFRAWAKYDNYSQDAKVAEHVKQITNLEVIPALRSDNNERFTLEGGAIETDGEGTLLTTEECLLSKIQERNPGLSKEGYEEIFAKYLGIKKTIWLGNGCQGDDTHGHIDDIARFVGNNKVLLAYEDNKNDENHLASEDNYQRLKAATDARGRKLEVIKLPMPRAIHYGEDRLPASYANFYIANTVVIVPTFNDEKDIQALQTIASVFPNRKIIGINCVDLVLGQGTLHCLTQQQPA